MEPSNSGKEILRKKRIFLLKNANFSNTCIILWLTFSATLHLGGGWGGGGAECILSGIAGMRGGREERPCPFFWHLFKKWNFWSIIYSIYGILSPKLSFKSGLRTIKCKFK